MPKPKPEGLPRKKPGPPPSGVRPSRLTLKSGEPWHAYMKELAAHVAMDKALIVDRGIELFAASVGFRPPPSRYDP